MSAEHNGHITRTYATHDDHGTVVEIHIDPSSKKKLWKTFWILLAITIFEVGIAFTSLPKEVLKWTFITLTLVKAYFIVFSFMHLGHEKKFMKYVILLPFLFILYLIVTQLQEATVIKGFTDFFGKY